jgi:2-polyprenyl-3-methyl-5-hydroxy-6-metoxy-1,4-benzoquinol methylase
MKKTRIKKLQLYGKLASHEDVARYCEHVKSHQDFSPKMRHLLKVASNMDNIRFLDIGCQMGEYIYHLSKHQNFKFLKGIDIEPEYIDLGKEYMVKGIGNVELKTQGLFSISNENKMSDAKNNVSNKNRAGNEKYDMIFMSEVIEHVDNPLAYIKKIYELLNESGYFIITTPNSLGMTNVLLNIKHFTDLSYIEKEKRGIGTETDHYYCWDKLTLFRLCNSQGFKYVEHHVTRKFDPLHGQSIIMILQK